MIRLHTNIFGLYPLWCSGRRGGGGDLVQRAPLSGCRTLPECLRDRGRALRAGEESRRGVDVVPGNTGGWFEI